jgi:MFS family permease
VLSTRRYVDGLRQLTPDLQRYYLAVALLGFAVDGGVYAVLLNLFLARLGYGPDVIGLVNAAGMVVFALVSLPAGIVGERWGSKRVMCWGLGLLVAGAVLLPLADLLPAAARLPWLMAMISCLYLGLALAFVNTGPLLLGLVATDQRNQAYATQTALLGLAAFLGSLLGGLLPTIVSILTGVALTQPMPYRYGLIVAGVAVIPGLLALARIQPGTVPELPAPPAGAPGTRAPTSILRLLSLIALVRVLQIAGLAVTSTFINLYLDAELRVPTAQIGLLLACGRLVSVPMALSGAALSARFGNRNVVIGACLATAVGMLPLALIPHWGAAALSLMIVSGLSGVRYAASMVYFLDLVPPNRRATTAGVTEMAAGICFTVLTFGGGYIITLLGYRALFLLGAAITGLSALVFWALFRGTRSTPRP